MKKIFNYFSLLLVIVISFSLISCKKKSVSLTNYMFNDGYVAASYKGNWGFLNKNGDTFINFEYDSATAFVDGYAILSKDNKFFVVNSNGDGVTKSYLNLKYLGNGYFSFYKDKSYGVINAKDKVILENKYASVEYFSGNVFICKKDGLYGLVSKRGKELCDFVYQSINEFHEGYALAKRDGLYGFINKDGKEIIPFDYLNSSNFVGKYVYVETQSNEKYIITNRNKIAFTIPSGYSLESFDENYIVISNDETQKVSLYNYKGKALITDASRIIVTNDENRSYVAAIYSATLDDKTTYSFNLYKYSNFKKIASSMDFGSGYNLFNYYLDYVTSKLYFRYLNDDGSKSMIYVFDGKSVELTDIVTTYYIKSISNGIVNALDNNGLPFLINGQYAISKDYHVLTVSFITTDGYIIYSDGTYYGAFDKDGKEILKCEYSHIKTQYTINA